MHTTARTRFTSIALILALGLTGSLSAAGKETTTPQKPKAQVQRKTTTQKGPVSSNLSAIMMGCITNTNRIRPKARNR